MNKQEAFQALRNTLTVRKSLLVEVAATSNRRLALDQLRQGLEEAEVAVLNFRDFILETDARYFSERELLAANKAMVLRAEYRKLASLASLTEYQGLVFEAEVLEDQFLILSKGV